MQKNPFSEKYLITIGGRQSGQKNALKQKAMAKLTRLALKCPQMGAALLTGELVGENGLIIENAVKTKLKQQDGSIGIGKKRISRTEQRLSAQGKGKSIVGWCLFCDKPFDWLRQAKLLHRKRFRFSREVMLLFDTSNNMLSLLEWRQTDIVFCERLYYCSDKALPVDFCAMCDNGEIVTLSGKSGGENNSTEDDIIQPTEEKTQPCAADTARTNLSHGRKKTLLLWSCGLLLLAAAIIAAWLLLK